MTQPKNDTTKDDTKKTDPPDPPDDDDTDDDDGDAAVLSAAGVKALRAERKENRTLKRQLAQLKGKTTPPKADKPATNGDTPAVVDEAAIRAKVTGELSLKFGAERARDKAQALLATAGYRGKLDRGVRLLDLEDVVGDDGKIDDKALRDAVDELKEDEPDRFSESDDEDEPRTARRSRGSADIGKKTPTTKPKSAAEALAERRFGKSRRR